MSGGKPVEMDMTAWLGRQLAAVKRDLATGVCNTYATESLRGQELAYELAIKKLDRLCKRPVTRGAR